MTILKLNTPDGPLEVRESVIRSGDDWYVRYDAVVPGVHKVAMCFGPEQTAEACTKYRDKAAEPLHMLVVKAGYSVAQCVAPPEWVDPTKKQGDTIKIRRPVPFVPGPNRDYPVEWGQLFADDSAASGVIDGAVLGESTTGAALKRGTEAMKMLTIGEWMSNEQARLTVQKMTDLKRGDEVVYRMGDDLACGTFWAGDICIVCEAGPAGLALFNCRSGELSPRGCDPAWFVPL